MPITEQQNLVDEQCGGEKHKWAREGIKPKGDFEVTRLTDLL